jgi:hypothetical protein
VLHITFVRILPFLRLVQLTGYNGKVDEMAGYLRTLPRLMAFACLDVSTHFMGRRPAVAALIALVTERFLEISAYAGEQFSAHFNHLEGEMRMRRSHDPFSSNKTPIGYFGGGNASVGRGECHDPCLPFTTHDSGRGGGVAVSHGSPSTSYEPFPHNITIDRSASLGGALSTSLAVPSDHSSSDMAPDSIPRDDALAAFLKYSFDDENLPMMGQ